MKTIPLSSSKKLKLLSILSVCFFSSVFSFYAIGQQCAENTVHTAGLSAYFGPYDYEFPDGYFGCGQSFTACADGSLDAITVRSHTLTASSGNVTLNVGTGNPDINPSNVLTYTVSIPSGIGEKTFDIPDYNMLSGNTYFFQLIGIPSQPYQEFSAGEGNPYRKGSAYVLLPENGFWMDFLGGDMYFKTTGSAFVLPIELIDFTGKSRDGKIVLNWRTASEINNKGFEIQRSIDGKNWNNLAFISGLGTTYKLQSYTYTVEHPLPGLNYYRLKQVDYDGAFEYSKIVSVEMKGESSGINLFPNPAVSTVTLMFQSDYSGEASLTLFDLAGRLVKTEILSLVGSDIRHKFGLEGLPAGVYLAEVVAGHEQWQLRLVVE